MSHCISLLLSTKNKHIFQLTVKSISYCPVHREAMVCIAMATLSCTSIKFTSNVHILVQLSNRFKSSCSGSREEDPSTQLL